MRPTINFGFAALVLGAAFASVPAFAQQNAPLSPGGISAAADSFGGPGPGYIGPATHGRPGNASPTNYSNTSPSGAPLSPGGISAAADSFGGPGPGYIAPETPGKALFAYAPAGLTAYSNTGPRGAPLSPGGIGTGADSFGGPGYVGP